MHITRQFSEAVLGGRSEEAIALLETWPVDLWYSIEPDQLGRLLSLLDEDAQRRSPTVEMFTEALSPKGSAPRRLHPVGPVPDTYYLWQSVVEAINARLSGDPVRAYELLIEQYDRLLGTKRYGIGLSDPLLKFVMRETAESALLAGLLPQALSLFEQLAGAPRTGGSTVFAREAHLRAALIHRLFGSTHTAAAHLRQASRVPRTSSWLEDQLDVDQELLEALQGHDGPNVTFSTLVDLSCSNMGELWPFTVIAVHAYGIITGRRDQARARLEGLAAAGYGHGRSGHASTVLPALLAYEQLLSGDVPAARSMIEQVSDDTWTVVLVRALIDIAAGAPMRALAALETAAEMTAGLPQAERHRLLAVAVIHHMAGDSAKTAAALSQLPALAPCGPYEVSVLSLLAPRTLTEVAAQVPGLLSDVPNDIDGVLEKPPLTRAELEVLSGLARGLNRTQIARELFRSVNTVKTHQRSLYRKLGASSASEAVARANASGQLRVHVPRAVGPRTAVQRSRAPELPAIPHRGRLHAPTRST